MTTGIRKKHKGVNYIELQMVNTFDPIDKNKTIKQFEAITFFQCPKITFILFDKEPMYIEKLKRTLSPIELAVFDWLNGAENNLMLLKIAPRFVKIVGYNELQKQYLIVQNIFNKFQ